MILLPYWNIAEYNKIWFNEHEGNAIAYFDTDNSTLVEYQIPTRGVLWGNTSNPLKFALDERGSGENKFGVLQSSEITDLPLWLTLSKNRITLDTSSGKGEKLMLYVYPNSTQFREHNKDNQVTPDGPIKRLQHQSLHQESYGILRHSLIMIQSILKIAI
jgi:virginiamycin B lyase